MTTVTPFSLPFHPVQLEGFGLILEPMKPAHEPGLAKAAEDGELWKIHYASVPAPDQEAQYIKQALHEQAQGKALVFTIRDAKTKEIIGTTRYYSIIPECARLHIGYTWYAQSYQRTFANTAAKYLLLYYAFESLKANVVAWRTDILNERSQKAIERLGAKKDGIIRGDQLRRDGTVRDSVVYSMTKDEWTTTHKTRLKSIVEQHHTL
ncbi:GNAT family N-acetyltransferase [Pelistega sp. NLN82]|uniref:GNAT family N-acetyltransferase n=1 Tax=Pelistega ratti TaxID=2652177 RepID=A0A6L9Y4Z6_9BURK|nr:GNAT family protein [Pelistega ratti]NEN75542.1 GNAT family N-acetyltransferase [Pelistega ratti]